MDAREQDAPESLSTERLEEALWVLESREGSKEAFTQLLARYERPILYFLRRLIREPEAAMDAHQEVWLEVFRNISQLKKPEAFRAWLYRIARGKAARFIRREVREGNLMEALEESHEAFSATEDSLDAEAVHRALDQLPIPQRETLTLHYLNDLSLEEISSILDCPVGTVKSRLHHGRLAVRALLEKEKTL